VNGTKPDVSSGGSGDSEPPARSVDHPKGRGWVRAVQPGQRHVAALGRLTHDQNKRHRPQAVAGPSAGTIVRMARLKETRVVSGGPRRSTAPRRRNAFSVYRPSTGREPAQAQVASPWGHRKAHQTSSPRLGADDQRRQRRLTWPWGDVVRAGDRRELGAVSTAPRRAKGRSILRASQGQRWRGRHRRPLSTTADVARDRRGRQGRPWVCNHRRLRAVRCSAGEGPDCKVRKPRPEGEEGVSFQTPAGDSPMSTATASSTVIPPDTHTKRQTGTAYRVGGFPAPAAWAPPVGTSVPQGTAGRVTGSWTRPFPDGPALLVRFSRTRRATHAVSRRRWHSRREGRDPRGGTSYVGPTGTAFAVRGGLGSVARRQAARRPPVWLL